MPHHGMVLLRSPWKLGLGAAVLLGALATGSAPASRAASFGSKPGPAEFLRVRTASHTVEVTLLASDGNGNGGFNFDGYGRGELTVTVPRGWRVVVHFQNRGARLASCAVVSGPNASTVAFAGASTPDPIEGTAPGRKATFAFRASRAGSYRFASMVAGQEEARMWDVLEVARGGRPSIAVRPGP